MRIHPWRSRSIDSTPCRPAPCDIPSTGIENCCVPLSSTADPLQAPHESRKERTHHPNRNCHPLRRAHAPQGATGGAGRRVRPAARPRMALRRAGRQPLPGPGRRDPRRDRWRCGRLWQHAHLRHQPCSCDRPWASRVPPASAAESSMLDFVAAPRQSGSRLSCPITISEDLDGIIDELPATQY